MCGQLVRVSEPGPIVTNCPRCGYLRLQFNKKQHLIETINSTLESQDNNRVLLLKIINEINKKEKKE
tara:strand:+ start:188 stop:388 length:201 start_codon:yes stop_codon:yes gene_type:complete